MKRFYTTLAAIAASLMFTTTFALAEGWYIKTIEFHETNTADCMAKSQAAFKGIAKTIQRGKDVVYGYDLDGRNPYDAIIICQRSNGAGREDTNVITVQLIIYDRLWTKKSRTRMRRLRGQIVQRYKDSMDE